MSAKEPYVTYEELLEYSTQEQSGTMDEQDAYVYLCRASEAVDVLTYSRIQSFDALTGFQQEKIRSVVAQLALWLMEYGDMLENPVSSYAINGVSVSMSGQQVVQISGVTIPQRLYGLLMQTGLCCGVLR